MSRDIDAALQKLTGYVEGLRTHMRGIPGRLVSQERRVLEATRSTTSTGEPYKVTREQRNMMTEWNRMSEQVKHQCGCGAKCQERFFWVVFNEKSELSFGCLLQASPVRVVFQEVITDGIQCGQIPLLQSYLLKRCGKKTAVLPLIVDHGLRKALEGLIKKDMKEAGLMLANLVICFPDKFSNLLHLASNARVTETLFVAGI